MSKLNKANKEVKNELEEALNEIEEEEAPRFNDEVEIEEDGYVHGVKLLAGYVDEEGILHDTFTYREMTGKDEEALNKADVRSNGAKIVNILVTRCVSEIGSLKKKDFGSRWGEVVRKLLGGDLDYMALKIRELSMGKEVEFQHKCPECGTKLTTIVSTDEFEILPFMGQYEVEFTLDRGYRDNKGETHKNGVLRLPNGADREIVVPLFRKNVSTATSMMLARLIRFNDGAYVSQALVAEMSLRDRDILEKIMKENVFGVDNSIELVCDSCGASISGELGQSNFL